MKRGILITLGLLLAFNSNAGETPSSTPGTASLKANISDLAWLAGAWHGTGLQGAEAAEAWSVPAGGQMVGHFRQLGANGAVQFYELIIILQRGDSLEMRIKHFNPDLTGWEKPGEYMSFPLIAVENSTWYFEGITLQRDASNKLTYFVRIQEQKDGSATEVVFRLVR